MSKNPTSIHGWCFRNMQAGESYIAEIPDRQATAFARHYNRTIFTERFVAVNSLGQDAILKFIKITFVL